MLSRSDKEAIINSLKVDFDNAKAVFLTNLIGVTSNDAVEIRKTVRDMQGKIVVTRNNLFKKAAEGKDVATLFENLKGPHAVAFAFEDVPGVAKCLKTAGAAHEVVELKSGFFDGKALSAADVKRLADLPSRDEMLGTLLATFIAPVSAFARVMHAIKEQKEAGATPAPVEA